ncbi:hypothetical protein ACS3SW_19265 [Roseobacteraceae bacterium S113]
MGKIFDVQLPFFIPLWRRVALVGLCFGWAALEYFAWGNGIWALLFLGIGSWCAHQFFVAFAPREPGDDG